MTTARKMLLRGTLRVGDNTTRQNMHLGMHITAESFDAIVTADKSGDADMLRATLNRVLADEYIGYGDVELLDMESLTYD